MAGETDLPGTDFELLWWQGLGRRLKLLLGNIQNRREPFLNGKGAPVFSFLGRRPSKAEKRQRAVIEGWNECLETVLKLLAEHKWVVDEDDPVEIFCDGCGESLTRALNGMRR